MTAAVTRAGRHRRIAEILERRVIRNQADLLRLLEKEDYRVTQATLSRDLDELGAVKVAGPDGKLAYAVPGEGGDKRLVAAITSEEARRRLSRVAAEVVVSAESSANLVIVRTPPGAAQYLASSFDHSAIPDILGTIAGDDTVLLITRRADGGSRVAAAVLALAGHPAARASKTAKRTNTESRKASK